MFQFLKPVRAGRVLTLLGVSAVGLAALSATTTPILAENLFDLEHARANARAGGPISDYDAELLERWGASSGTYYDPDRNAYYRTSGIKRYQRRHSRERRYAPRRKYSSY